MSMQLTQSDVQQNEIAHSKSATTRQATIRLAGYTALSGALIMIVGAALWGTSGTDLWVALDNNTMADYLTTAATVQGQLVANLSLWILGAFVLGIAGTQMAQMSLSRSVLAYVAQACYRTAVPLVIVSYIAMLAVVVQIAPDTSPTAVAIAEVVGWIGVRADDLGTALIIGFGPLFIALAARGDWLPTWLVRLGYLTGLLGLVTVIAMFSPSLTSYGFIILPFGLIWMIATGITLLRRASK